MSVLRPYQRDAIDAIDRSLVEHRSTLATLPTGTGKTVVFARVADCHRPRGRILVLAHRQELLAQAAEKIRAWTRLTVGIERADCTVLGSELPDVVVASVQSLSRPKRLAQFAPNAFGLVIIDEAHHAPARTYQRIVAHFADAKVLGVTATADRLDGVGLGRVFDDVAYSYGLRDAIKDGWLARLSARRVVVDEIDLRRVRKSHGDFVESDLESELCSAEAIAGVARPTVELAAGRLTLVFAVTVRHAQALADALNAIRAGSARWLSGASSSSDRAATLEAYTRGAFQFLVGCMLFTEGFDCPPIACVTMARPTKSRALYAQMVGRGTRLHPGKSELLVLDLVGNVRHGLSLAAADLLADGAVLADAVGDASERDTIDVLDTVENEAERQRAEALRREAAREASVRYRSDEIDPLAERRGPPATERQRAVLERNGLPVDVDLATANRCIAELVRRSQRGLCTMKQAKLLERYGLSGELPFVLARAVIDQIAGNGWRLPPHIAADRSLRRRSAA